MSLIQVRAFLLDDGEAIDVHIDPDALPVHVIIKQVNNRGLDPDDVFDDSELIQAIREKNLEWQFKDEEEDGFLGETPPLLDVMKHEIYTDIFDKITLEDMEYLKRKYPR